MAKFDVDKATKAGYSQDEINQFMQQNNLSPKLSLAGFGRNVGRSAGNLIGNTVSGVANIFNPDMEKNTGYQLLNLATGIVDSILPGEQGNEKYAKALADYFVDRYGSIENIGNTFYTDPVGMLDDVSMFFTGGGSAAKNIGKFGKFDDLARIGSKVQNFGQAIDPLLMAGRGIGKVAEGGSNLIGGTLQKGASGLADELMLKSLRPSPSQISQFENLTGMKLQDYLRKNKIYGSADDISKIIEDTISGTTKPAYNNLVRTGEIVDPTPYIDQLRQQAKKIIQSDFSEEAQKVSNDLMKRADNLETKSLQYMQANNTSGIPIDIITETKSSTFSKVPKGALMDSTTLLGSKQAGGIGIGVLEDLAPGSQKLGKELQAQMLLKNVADKQKGLGKGSQVLNAFKPVGYGSGLGGILGGVQGAITGGIVASAVNNPKVISKITQGLDKFSNAKMKLPKVNTKAYKAISPFRPILKGVNEGKQRQEEKQLQGVEKQKKVVSQKPIKLNNLKRPKVLSSYDNNNKNNPFRQIVI